uniref:Phage portal protein n=1 Tax=uncultured organism TaxID=155900 RepID=A0A7L9QBR9_9ZZZZ|nr:hypothetical protein [uncultured organism]
MSFFAPKRTEQRSLSYQDVWGSGGEWGGDSLSASSIDSALRLAPVYAATSLIGDLISTSPRQVFRERQPGVLETLPRQPQLAINPQPVRGNWIDWSYQWITSVLLEGNAYGYIVDIDNYGTPTKIIWLNPYNVSVIEDQRDWFHTPSFYWRGIPLDPMLVVHIPGYVTAGTIKGLSPIGLFKKQIETGLHAQNFQLDWYKHGAAPSGWFKNTGQTLGDGVAEKIKERFRAATLNRDLLVTGNDWDWTQLGIPADQAQFLQAIEANATTIASIFHLDPESIGGSTGGASGGKSSTYKTLEQDALKMNTRALRPWAARFEETISAYLPGQQRMKINLRHLAKGTILEQAQAHQINVKAGLETQGEARADEGREPMTTAETTFWQENYNTQYTDPSADDPKILVQEEQPAAVPALPGAPTQQAEGEGE